MSGCRAVIFGMDGLMLDTERVDQAACTRAAASMGVPLDDALYLRAATTSRAANPHPIFF